MAVTVARRGTSRMRAISPNPSPRGGLDDDATAGDGERSRGDGVVAIAGVALVEHGCPHRHRDGLELTGNALQGPAPAAR